MNYEIAIEQTENGFSAYVPDLPGCVAAAETREETIALLRESIALHLQAQEHIELPPDHPATHEFVEILDEIERRTAG